MSARNQWFNKLAELEDQDASTPRDKMLAEIWGDPDSHEYVKGRNAVAEGIGGSLLGLTGGPLSMGLTGYAAGKAVNNLKDDAAQYERVVDGLLSGEGVNSSDLVRNTNHARGYRDAQIGGALGGFAGSAAGGALGAGIGALARRSPAGALAGAGIGALGGSIAGGLAGTIAGPVRQANESKARHARLQRVVAKHSDDRSAMLSQIWGDPDRHERIKRRSNVAEGIVGSALGLQGGPIGMAINGYAAGKAVSNLQDDAARYERVVDGLLSGEGVNSSDLVRNTNHARGFRDSQIGGTIGGLGGLVGGSALGGGLGALARRSPGGAALGAVIGAGLGTLGGSIAGTIAGPIRQANESKARHGRLLDLVSEKTSAATKDELLAEIWGDPDRHERVKRRSAVGEGLAGSLLGLGSAPIGMGVMGYASGKNVSNLQDDAARYERVVDGVLNGTGVNSADLIRNTNHARGVRDAQIGSFGGAAAGGILGATIGAGVGALSRRGPAGAAVGAGLGVLGGSLAGTIAGPVRQANESKARHARLLDVASRAEKTSHVKLASWYNRV